VPGPRHFRVTSFVAQRRDGANLLNGSRSGYILPICPVPIGVRAPDESRAIRTIRGEKPGISNSTAKGPA
jgi:hypothetical protein